MIEQETDIRRMLIEIDGKIKRDFEIAILKNNHGTLKSALTNMIKNYIKFSKTQKKRLNEKQSSISESSR